MKKSPLFASQFWSRTSFAFGPILFVLPLLAQTPLAMGVEPPASTPQDYRNLVLKVRTEGRFSIPQPGGADWEVSYSFKLGAPKQALPDLNDFTLEPAADGTPRWFRSFWDQIYLEDGSYLEINGERLPLTCISVNGQDNRFSGDKSPLFPDWVIHFRLVVNDYSCTGPVNPGWPDNGGKKEMWDTLLSFVVRDPTIMLPMEARVRDRWNEFSAVWLNVGGNSQ